MTDIADAAPDLEAGYRRLLAEYEELRENLPDALVEVAIPSLRVTYMNHLARSLFGYREEDVAAGLDAYRLVSASTFAMLIGELQKHLATMRPGEPYRRQPGQQVYRATVIRKDGTSLPAEAMGAYVLDAAGRPIGVRFIVRDVSGRVAEERERLRLGAIVEAASDAIVSRDLEGRILSWNRGAEQLYGWTAAEMIGQTADRLVPPGLDPAEDARTTFRRALGGEAFQVVTRRQHRDGRVMDLDLSLFPIRDEEGRVVAVGGIARDISERLRMTAELERTNRMLAAITRAQTEFIRAEEPQAVFEGLLEALLEVTASEYGFIGEVLRGPDGHPRLHAIALTYPTDPFDRARIEAAAPAGMVFDNLDTLFGVTLRTGEAVISNDPARDTRARGTPPGHPPLRAYLGLPITSRGELVGQVGVANRPGGYSEEDIAFLQPFLATCATLIEAIRAERRRRAEAERLSAAIDRSDLGLWEWDIPRMELHLFAGDVAPVSPGSASIEAWLERVHPDDRDRLSGAFRDHAEGRAAGIDAEFRYLLPGGAWEWVLARGRIVERAPNGQPLRAVGSFLDITARKEWELERATLEVQVRQAQKLESLGVLVGGVAHDFNNLLTAIIGNLYLLRRSLPDDPEVRELLEGASSAAERGAGLVRRLLAYGRPGIDQPIDFSIDDLIDGAVTLARGALEPRVRVVVRRSRLPAAARGSPAELEQVLINLFMNARDAMPAGGTVTVSRSIVDIGPRHRWAPPALPRGRYHVIAVRDTGTGIPPEILERIFDPFFTTKGVGRGTGLGLSTALAIARAHGGWLAAESTPGRGATFRLLLPVPSAAPAGADG
ncbi:PAS domain S-box protein [Tepidiforma sp.]|uniref:PAS domain S-box protein n=1 Tax=Tepidiforma sp. TaxID=2682230 RepID=UPI002ADDFCF2|nr:PAS domain S-box protein [Tepidiforma sp.]